MKKQDRYNKKTTQKVSVAQPNNKCEDSSSLAELVLVHLIDNQAQNNNKMHKITNS